MATSKANVLSQKASFVVMTYMQEHKQEIEKFSGTIRELADEIKKKTGVLVTDNNIRSLASAVDVKLPISNGNQASYIYATLLRRVTALEERLQKLLDSLGVDAK